MHAPLVSCETLFENIDSDGWVVFDCRHELSDAQAGPLAYAEGHIPGAFHAHIDHDLSSPVGDGSRGRHPMPDAEAFVTFLGKHGVGPDTQVVVYDEGPGTWAARLWWLLRDYGHEAVAVLDGGLARWKTLGLPLTSDEPTRGTGSFEGSPGHMPTVQADDLDSYSPIMDARAPERFRGDIEPIDPVAGHIPGAINTPFSANVGPDHMFLGPDELRALYEDKQGGAAYCGSGVTAAHTVLAMDVAGLELPALYPGSWSEWCTAGRPVETGPTDQS